MALHYVGEGPHRYTKHLCGLAECVAHCKLAVHVCGQLPRKIICDPMFTHSPYAVVGILSHARPYTAYLTG
jgi:hypothetical protein